MLAEQAPAKCQPGSRSQVRGPWYKYSGPLMTSASITRRPFKRKLCRSQDLLLTTLSHLDHSGLEENDQSPICIENNFAKQSSQDLSEHFIIDRSEKYLNCFIRLDHFPECFTSAVFILGSRKHKQLLP